MASELYLHTLRQLRDGCKAEHMDTETAALEAAIKALSCEGDCISRQAAIDVASGYCHPANIANELRKLPSVQTDIIRCKDCKKAPKCYGDVLMKSKGGGYIYCPVEYCSEAERRTDG